MNGISDLSKLLANLNPKVAPNEYVFLSRPKASYGEGAELEPIGAFEEGEGLTRIVPREQAAAAGESCDVVFRLITLRVHSSLEAVGLTATVATALAEQGISANVVAGYYHDHVFVPAARVNDALEALAGLA